MSSDAQATPSQPSVSAHAQPEQPAFRVFRPPQTAPTMAPSELPESYFTPTAADLKTAQESLAARTQALVNAPLRTQAMRDEEQKAKLAKYPTTTIRIKFPDRTQLEKAFPSGDRIRSVYAFVRSSLREDVKPVKFVLYQTPPKRELKVSDLKVRDLTLLQLQLAPSSVLHLKFEDESLNHMNIPAPLDPSVLATAEDLPQPATFEGPPTTSGPSQEKPLTPVSSGSSSSKGTAQVPKWLKLGSKKQL
ncbi:hypothetical protein BC835DRAFT_1419442 [Cytidiella melzeri]|nr:hypothetical protein BC835DRAFT_1419442 [Cytidiella melzeri]